jgi:hypothetical protein
MAEAALFYPEMTHFTLPLHALREELIELADGARELWTDGVPMLAAAGTAVFDFGEGE